jgi:Transglutaminase-like superfamily
VKAALRRRGHPCIERSLVLQAWHAAHGERRDVIVGVTAPGNEFRAHAWLDGDEPCAGERFAELTRRRPSNATDRDSSAMEEPAR